MSPKTKTCIAAIRKSLEIDPAATLAPCTFSVKHGRATVSAAFRIAKRDGIIEVAYISAAGTPVYRAATPTAPAGSPPECLPNEDVDETHVDRPVAGKIYRLFGGPGVASVAKGDSWSDSVV